MHSADGYLRPSPSPTRLKHSSETPENDAISYSDAESDSGFESGTHTSSCTSEATIASHHNEPVATMSSKSEDSESDEDERIEKAILHLDVKVGVNRLKHSFSSEGLHSTISPQCAAIAG